MPRPFRLRRSSSRHFSACASAVLLSLLLPGARGFASPAPKKTAPATASPSNLAPRASLNGVSQKGAPQSSSTLGGPLGGPSMRLVDTPPGDMVTKSLAATRPPSVGDDPDDNDNPPPPGTPKIPGVTYSTAGDQSTNPLEPPAALGPAPYDLGTIQRLQVTTQNVAEAPMRVGNLDILSPLVEEFPLLGATVTRADPRNVPGAEDGSIAIDSQYFQVNLQGSSPIVLCIGQAKAWIDKNEQTLRAAPLVIDKKIYLPVFSLAPLIGAAARLDNTGTLILTPTVQSVELFPYQNSVAVTVKLSTPVPPEGFKLSFTQANGRPRLFVDFPGYSMGFDAANTPDQRQVANPSGDVLQARAGMPQQFPDITRITADLKRPQTATIVRWPDPRIFAFVLSGPTSPAPTPPTSSGPATGGPVIYNDPLPPISSGKPLAGMLIVIDPGHGGHDTGARGARSDEKNNTLDISQRLVKDLQSLGANAQITRNDDTFISLQGRVDYANYRKADLFIAIHNNASVNKGSTGTETFYYTAISQSLAREIHKELSKATGCPNRGISQARFFVIRKTWMPSVLLECAFITNSGEEAKLINPTWREKVARSVTQGVVNYVRVYGRPGLRG